MLGPHESGHLRHLADLLMGEVEQRVLSALRGYLLSPEVVASAVEAYQVERKRLGEVWPSGLYYLN